MTSQINIFVTLESSLITTTIWVPITILIFSDFELYINRTMQLIVFISGSFDASQSYWDSSKFLHVSAFSFWHIVVHSINMLQLVYPLCWCTCRLLPVFGDYNRTSMNILTQVFLWKYTLMSSEYILRHGIVA